MPIILFGKIPRFVYSWKEFHYNLPSSAGVSFLLETPETFSAESEQKYSPKKVVFKRALCSTSLPPSIKDGDRPPWSSSLYAGLLLWLSLYLTHLLHGKTPSRESPRVGIVISESYWMCIEKLDSSHTPCPSPEGLDSPRLLHRLVVLLQERLDKKLLIYCHNNPRDYF